MNEPYLNTVSRLLDGFSIPPEGITVSSSSRRDYAVYPFARPSLSSSGAFFHIDNETGELFALMVRRRKDSYQWFYPAGYVEILKPEGRENKNKLMVYEELRRLTKEKGWSEASRLINDVSYLWNFFQQHDSKWNPLIDFSSKAGFLRETWEETGLDLGTYPDHVIQMVRSEDVISIGSGGNRLYNVDQHYFGYLGVLQEAPRLSPLAEEIVEAAWINVSKMRQDTENQSYIIANDSRPMPFHGIKGMEYSLNALLNFMIARVSVFGEKNGSLFSGALAVKSFILHQQMDKLSGLGSLAALQFSLENMLPMLIGGEGQLLFRQLICAAYAIAQRKSMEEIEKILQYAQESKTFVALFPGISFL